MMAELTDDQIVSLLGQEMIGSDEDFTRFARLIIAADRAQRQAVPPERSSERAVMQQALDALVDSRPFSKRHGQVIGLLVEAIAQPVEQFIWADVGKLIDVNNQARTAGLMVGTSNWGAFVCNAMVAQPVEPADSVVSHWMPLPSPPAIRQGSGL